MERLDLWISKFASMMWGLPLLALLVLGGLYLVMKIRFLPYRFTGHAIDILRGKYNDQMLPGDIHPFQALMTALSSTIGMGNIAGVAVAISIGGPGAIFWMWVSGVIGMCTKFFTCSLAILYRGKDSEGQAQGGPMYFLTEGLGKRWRPMAQLFCLAGLIGALPVFNTNQLTQAFRDIILVPNGWYSGISSDIGFGVFLVILTSIVILGGIKRIGTIAGGLVPFMVLLYLFSVAAILIIKIDVVPHYITLIFTDAFEANHFKGDAFLGGTLGGLILLGIRRGAFSNEAGIGTAPMAHGASKTSEPIREGLTAMLGPFIDTVVVCTLTALAILVTGVWETSSDNGVSLAASAFNDALPGFGKYLLMACISVFSISSLFSFSYYGTKCLSFLIGADRSHYYNYFYLISILIGASTTLSMMINLIDGFYAIMAIPTMTGTILLAPKVVARAKTYFSEISTSRK